MVPNINGQSDLQRSCSYFVRVEVIPSGQSLQAKWFSMNLSGGQNLDRSARFSTRSLFRIMIALGGRRGS